MPIPGARYATVTTSGGKKMRYAFKGGKRGKGGKMVEAKNLTSGAVHTPGEFAADAAKRKRKPGDIDRMLKRGKHVAF